MIDIVSFSKILSEEKFFITLIFILKKKDNYMIMKFLHLV